MIALFGGNYSYCAILWDGRNSEPTYLLYFPCLRAGIDKFQSYNMVWQQAAHVFLAFKHFTSWIKKSWKQLKSTWKFCIYLACSCIMPDFSAFATLLYTSSSPLITTTTFTNPSYYLLIHISLVQFIWCIFYSYYFFSAQAIFFSLRRVLSASFAFRRVRIFEIRVIWQANYSDPSASCFAAKNYLHSRTSLMILDSRFNIIILLTGLFWV